MGETWLKSLKQERRQEKMLHLDECCGNGIWRSLAEVFILFYSSDASIKSIVETLKINLDLYVSLTLYSLHLLI